MARVMCLGLGLVFLNTGESSEAALSVIEAVEHPIKQLLALTVEACAYFGTGSVLVIQKLLSICGEHIEDEKKNQHQVRKRTSSAVRLGLFS